jgi:hypothetical protein
VEIELKRGEDNAYLAGETPRLAEQPRGLLWMAGRGSRRPERLEPLHDETAKAKATTQSDGLLGARACLVRLAQLESRVGDGGERGGGVRLVPSFCCNSTASLPSAIARS